MEALDVLLRLVGAFYVFGGFLVAKVTVIAAFADESRASVELGAPAKIPRHNALCLLVTSTLVFVGGLMLFLLVAGAQWVFLVCAAWQFVYLSYLAPRYFDQVDPPAASGRQQNTNAFYFYCVATALVVFAASRARLRPIAEQPPVLMAMACVLLAAYAIAILRGLRR